MNPCLRLQMKQPNDILDAKLPFGSGKLQLGFKYLYKLIFTVQFLFVHALFSGTVYINSPTLYFRTLSLCPKYKWCRNIPSIRQLDPNTIWLKEETTGKESTDESPMLWRKINKSRFSLLSQLAARYLAIPATSVPCERVFSTAGHVVNDKRAFLLPKNVNMLVFLAENLD